MKGGEKMDKGVPVCSCSVIHSDRVEHVKEKSPSKEMLTKLGEFFKVFGDPTRMRIIAALYESEMCVCDLSSLLGMSQSAVSHQLRVLKASGAVRFERVGKVVYYNLDDDHVKSIYMMGLSHMVHKLSVINDMGEDSGGENHGGK
jgi:ArsR family transcriptional regulator, lead/cadmium/zinc/bismuth-responsive transcriptional repressor